MRTFGVEEELLLVDGATLEPLPAGDRAAHLHQRDTDPGHRLTPELQREQIEIASPPQTTLAGQLAAIQAGRAMADAVAARVGGRVAALPTAPGPVHPHLVPDPRYRRIAEQFALVADEQLTCGFHVHVGVESREEAVAVLDRVRVWLPVLLALSANSPFWRGIDTGYASYRYQVWGRLPTAGPTEVFGSAAGYDRRRRELLATGVPLDAGMLYFDARLSEHLPTLEMRVADVCLAAEHAAVLATLARGLVETAARGWRAGDGVPDVSASSLRAWMWRASRYGVEGRLVSPATGIPVPAADVVAQLLDVLRPVLTEYREDAPVESVLTDILRNGTGARRQREAFGTRREVHDVVRRAIRTTHQEVEPPSGPSSAPA